MNNLVEQNPMKTSSEFRKHSINMSFIVLISIGITFFVAGTKGGVISFVQNVLYGVLIGTSIGVGSSLVSRYFFNKKNWIEKPSRIFTQVILATAVYILLDVFVVNLIWFYATQGITPIKYISHPFGLNIMLLEFIIGMVIYLFLLSKKYAKTLEENYLQLISAEKETEKYRYTRLKDQIDPHFLFNTLNTLSGLIYIDVQRSDEFIQHFASIYRYVLDVQQLDVIELEKEIAFIHDYTFLNNIRFDNQIKMKMSVEGIKQYIVPMSLQLLIENAIKHNIVNAEQPLHIHVYKQGSTLFIENNLNLKQSNESSNKLGLENLKKRYARVSDVEIIIEQTDTTYTVGLPLLRDEE